MLTKKSIFAEYSFFRGNTGQEDKYKDEIKQKQNLLIVTILIINSNKLEAYL